MKWLFYKIMKLYRQDKGLAYVTFGNTISAIIGALFWLILASILMTESYGKVNYMISLALTLSALSMLGSNTTIITYLAKKEQKVTYQANLLVLISASLVATVVWILIKNIPSSLLIIAMCFFAMTVAELFGRKLYQKYGLIIIGERAMQFVLSFSLYFLIGLEGIIVGYAISALIFSYRYFQSFNKLTFDFSVLRTKLKFMFHSYSIGLSQSITINADKLIIAPIFGFSILGLYQLGFQFLMFLAIIPISLYQYLLPQESSGLERFKVRIGGFILSGMFAIIFIFISPVLIQKFFPNFVESIPATQIMSLGAIPMTLISIMHSRFLGKENSKPVFIGAILYLSVLSVLIYFLGTLFGLIGLAISIVISLSVQSAWLWLARIAVTTPEHKK